MRIELNITPIEWLALRDALGHAADELHAAPGHSWGPFGIEGYAGDGVEELSGQQAEEALVSLGEQLAAVDLQRFAGIDRALVDYTVRNITTGDEEDIRVLELTREELDAALPPITADQVYGLIAMVGWGTDYYDSQHWQRNQERILEWLLPWIHDPGLYERDYAKWEQNVLDGVYEAVAA